MELAHERGAVKTNTSGYPGVSRAKYGKWQAKITWDYKQVNLGASFETAEDASEMYEEAARRLKAGASTDADRRRVLAELNLWRRQMTAWKHLRLSHPDHAWPSFEAFCADVIDTPKTRYAMVAIDVTQPIGPHNFRWALPVDAEHSTRDGIVAYHRVVRQANRDHERNKQLQKDFNIDMAEYLRLLNEQTGVCAICEKPEQNLRGAANVTALSVDHNHTNGNVRGLLCGHCNVALGYFCDDARLLERAAAYLRQYDGDGPVWSMPTVTEITHLPIGQKILMEAALNG